MEQNTETKTETKLKPEEMPEYQGKLSQLKQLMKLHRSPKAMNIPMQNQEI